MSAVINVLAIVGFLAIIIYVIYSIWKYFDKINRENALAKIRPTMTYMQNVGMKCPDYWDLVEVDAKGNYICQDTYGLMAKNGKVRTGAGGAKTYDATCVDSNLSDPNGYAKMGFVGLPEGFRWETMTDEQKIQFASKAQTTGTGNVSRKDWIRSCGAGAGIDAVWSGFEPYIR